MAFNHMVMIFNTPVIGVFDLDVIKLKAYYTSTVGPTGPKQERLLTLTKIKNPTSSFLEGVDLNKQVLLEFDECFNNAIGTIRVEYESGLVGWYGEPVEPFVKEYTPLEMPYKPEPYNVENTKFGAKGCNLNLHPITWFSKDHGEGTAILDAIEAKGCTLNILYVGEIKP